MTNPSSSEDPLARFAVKKRERATATSRIKDILFEPNKSLKLSVYRVKGWQKPEIHFEGLDVVIKRQDAKHLYGWALFDLSVVCLVGLCIKHDPLPSRHSDIIGWTSEEQRRIQTRQQLALRSYDFIRLYPECRPGGVWSGCYVHLDDIED